MALGEPAAGSRVRLKRSALSTRICGWNGMRWLVAVEAVEAVDRGRTPPLMGMASRGSVRYFL